MCSEEIKNGYFGSEIILAALLTVAGVLAARERITGAFVVLSGVAVKSDEPVLLGVTTLAETLKDDSLCPFKLTIFLLLPASPAKRGRSTNTTR